MAYTIYELLAPDGRRYIGCTKQAVGERFRQHTNRAKSGHPHALYEAVRFYGAEAFTFRALSSHDDKDAAHAAEAAAIQRAGSAAYNVSPGGAFDSATGVRRLCELMADPTWREGYLARLREGLRQNPQTRGHIAARLAGAKQWRADNPREVWRIAYRASRIAKRSAAPRDRQTATLTSETRARMSASQKEYWQKAPLSARLRKSRTSRASAGKQWAGRSVEEKRAVSEKIAASVAAFHHGKTAAARAAGNAQLVEARKNINHDLRKARQKEALKAYWTPERRAAKAEQRREQAAAKRREKECAPTTS